MNRHGQHGYAMAALIVSMSVMAILLTAAMPVWRQNIRREKEAELVFRGEQYARAIGLYQKKAGPGVLPPDLDVLIDQKYLRKKYKDPITGGDFDLLRVNSANGPGSQPGPQGGTGVGTPQRSPNQPAPGQSGFAAGGIMGVASKSTETSLRVYEGRTHYNEWQFVYVQQAQAPGAGASGGANGGGAGVGGRGNNGRGGQGNPQGGGVGGRGRGNQPSGGRGGFGSGGGQSGFPPFGGGGRGR